MTNVASVLWRCIDKAGHDFCRLGRDPSGWRVEGVSVFLQDFQPAMLSYSVECNPRWETVSGRVRGSIGSQNANYAITRQNGIWTLNGAPVESLDDLVDLDLSFTPATNLIQIRRISLPENEIVEAPVAWFDVLSGTLTRLPQIYQRRSERLIWYEAPTVGYRGLLELDVNGFISHYPGLWKMETGR